MLRAMPQLRALRLASSTPLLLALALLACDGGDEAGNDESDADLANGEAIHDGTCMVAACHPANGIDFVEHIPEHGDDELRDIISMGEGMMPAQTQLSEQDITDVIAYMRTIY